jgi:hypothetical protein
VFDYEFFAWWGGLNPVLRFGLTMTVLLIGALLLVADAWLWGLSILVIGVIMLIATFEIKDG